MLVRIHIIAHKYRIPYTPSMLRAMYQSRLKPHLEAMRPPSLPWQAVLRAALGRLRGARAPPGASFPTLHPAGQRLRPRDDPGLRSGGDTWLCGATARPLGSGAQPRGGFGAQVSNKYGFWAMLRFPFFAQDAHTENIAVFAVGPVVLAQAAPFCFYRTIPEQLCSALTNGPL